MSWMSFFEKICCCLNKAGVRYCLLRMPTELEEEERPGDVDLLVDRHELNQLYDILAKSFDLERLSFIQTHAQIPVVDRASGLSITLDLHVKLYVGMSGGLFPFSIEDAVLASAKLDGDIPRPAFEYEYTLLMFHTLADKPTIPEARLHHLFSLLSTAQEHKKSILEMWGEALGDELAGSLWQALMRENIVALKVLRRRILRHLWLKSPAESMRHILGSQIRARSYLWTWPLVKPLTVAMVGPDGVGKSTLGKAMAEHPRISYRYFGNQGAFLPTTKLIYTVWNSNQDVQVSRPGTQENENTEKRTKPARRSLKERLKDVSTRPLLRWHHAAEMGARYLNEISNSDHDVIIFDRYIYDMCINELQSTSKPLWKRALRKFYLDYFPKPDLLVLLVADPELIYRRKQERQPAELLAYMEAYRDFIKIHKLDERVSIIQELQTDESEVRTATRLWSIIEKARLSRIISHF